MSYKFKPGDKVEDIRLRQGCGTVKVNTDFPDPINYPIFVKYECGAIDTYTEQGIYNLLYPEDGPAIKLIEEAKN